jgi:long-chain acyl-CoA synthetase
MSHILGEQTVRSIPELLRLRAQETPASTAMRYPDGESWSTISWGELYERVKRVAAGLRSFGVGSEDRVALLCSTRLEWVVADLAILAAGGATTTIYPSNTAEECAFIISDSGARVVIVENPDQHEKIRQVADELPLMTNTVVIDGEAEGATTISELAKLGDVAAIEGVMDTIEPDHLATLIYTSGTTGRPKGVELTHDNWLYTAEATSQVNILRSDDLQFLWLPLSHSFGKVIEVLMIDVGCETAIDGRVDKIVENLATIRPTLMAAAPRIFEKVYNVAVSSIQAEGGPRLAIFRWAVGVGTKVVRARQRGEEPGRLLALQYAIADRLVFAKLRDRFGGRVRNFVSGSAPLSADLAEFFDAAGLTILEGYGLTESSASTFVNPPGAPRFGTVGPPIPGTEVRIADDGEILVRSRAIMRGYHGLPEETADTLHDGWLLTGDIGELDDHGYLRITDRKKELIKTSGGKYVAPAKIEGLVKDASPYISNVLVHGDRRKYCVALVTLDPDAIANWAKEKSIPNDPAAIADNREMVAVIEAAVAEMNRDLASYETIKKVTILPGEFTIESGELTPSMKVKRKVVEQHNADRLDAMYESELAP